MAIEAEQRGDPGSRRQASFFRTLATEQEDLLKVSSRQLEKITSLGDLPLRVIGSSVPNPQFGASAEAFQALWIDENRRLAGFSTQGRFILAEGSTHAIHKDAPGMVISAVREISTQKGMK